MHFNRWDFTMNLADPVNKRNVGMLDFALGSPPGEQRDLNLPLYKIAPPAFQNPIPVHPASDPK